MVGVAIRYARAIALAEKFEHNAHTVGKTV